MSVLFGPRVEALHRLSETLNQHLDERIYGQHVHVDVAADDHQHAAALPAHVTNRHLDLSDVFVGDILEFYFQSFGPSYLLYGR